MLLVSVGNEIAGGATVNNSYVFAKDDIQHTALGEIAHPENVKNSYGWYLSQKLGLAHKCYSGNYTDNQQIYSAAENFLLNVLPNLKSNYTVIAIGWLPEEKNHYDEKIKQLIHPSTEYYSFDMLLDFVSWSKQHNQLNQFNYPTRAAHQYWAQHLFEKIIDNHS